MPEHEAAAAPGALAGVTQELAAAATARGAAWDGLADVVAADPVVVDDLRSGRTTQTWRAALRLFGDDLPLARTALMTLETYARGAVRRGEQTDREVFAAGHAALVAGRPPAERELREVAELCRSEASAWASADLATGRALRAAQLELVGRGLADELDALGRRLVDGAERPLWRVLGQLVLTHLAAETGRRAVPR